MKKIEKYFSKFSVLRGTPRGTPYLGPQTEYPKTPLIDRVIPLGSESHAKFEPIWPSSSFYRDDQYKKAA